MSITLKGRVTEITSDDGGQSLCAQINNDEDEDQENDLFVNIMSWDENKEHADFKALIHEGDTVEIRIISTSATAE